MSTTISGLQELMLSTDPDADLRAAYTARITAAKSELRQIRTSDTFRILLVGYNGACNSGADLRTGEIVRQLRNDFPAESLELGILKVGDLPLPDWEPITCEYMGGFAPDAVYDLCSRYDAVIVCEGSVFTSTFADGLATMLTAFLGMATALGKPAVAWGAEADEMSPAVRNFVADTAKGALLVPRNSASAHRLQALGLSVDEGTDTGWTFDDIDDTAANEHLRALGWDGTAPIIAIAATNPFRWPLVPDTDRALFASLSGEAHPDHHSGIMFFQPTDQSDQRYDQFIGDITDALRAHNSGQEQPFPLVIGMEANDRNACASLAEKLGAPTPVVAGETPPQVIIAMLRRASMIISARYHAILLSMSAGVPAIGLAYDQRVAALLADVSLPELAIDVHSTDLVAELGDALDRVGRDESVGPIFAAYAAKQRALQVEMGERVISYLKNARLENTALESAKR